MKNAVFEVNAPEKEKRVPILISSPHSGTMFPPGMESSYGEGVVNHPEDTDWFVDQLYDGFVSSLGITLIKANYSRYVIDLNRDPKSKSLYKDGRPETSLVPVKSFSGEELYRVGQTPGESEIERRYNEYYLPYYQKIEEILLDLQSDFSQVLFFDAHSIKDFIPSISEEIFPDLMLGDNDGKTCAEEVLLKAKSVLESGEIIWDLGVNKPFKGGHFTRFFGRPDAGVHSLQLEMSQSVYMEDNQKRYDRQRAEVISEPLKEMFTELIALLKSKQ